MEVLEKNISLDEIYWDREEKASFIVKNFGVYLAEPLLDIGCDKKQLYFKLPGSFNYRGLDISHAADIICDLDRSSVPLRDKTYNTVLCSDVLEHLENIHFAFSELFRVARKYVIVSLPNCWCDFKFLIRQIDQPSGKFYGLPLSPPADRHRWFFNFLEARDFLVSQPVARRKAKTLTIYKYYGARSISYYLGRLMLTRRKFDNLFVNTLWAVYTLE